MPNKFNNDKGANKCDNRNIAPIVKENDKVVIQRKQEELHIQKQGVETGKVKVHMSTETQAFEDNVKLLVNDYTVNRIAKDEFVDKPIDIKETEEAVIISVVEEVLVVEKKLKLVEEIHIRKNTSLTTEKISADLKKQIVHIEKIDALESD